MGPFEMVVYIVLISVAGGIIGKMIAAKHGGRGDDTGSGGKQPHGPRNRRHAWGPNQNAPDDLKPYLEKIDALEERIRVLERIVTDKSERLSREIDELQ